MRVGPLIHLFDTHDYNILINNNRFRNLKNVLLRTNNQHSPPQHLAHLTIKPEHTRSARTTKQGLKAPKYLEQIDSEKSESTDRNN